MALASSYELAGITPSQLGSYNNFQANSTLGGFLNNGYSKGGSLFGNMNGLEALQLGLSGLSTIGNIWNAYQANKLAKEQFAFTKDITNANLANQIKSYNTTLEDRARSRGFVEGRDDGYIQDYIDKNSLSR